MGSHFIFYGIRKQVAGFLTAGGLATSIHWVAMGFLVELGAQPVIATATGSIAGAIANYGLQRRLAFRKAGPHGQTLWRYLASCGLAWFANLTLFSLLSHGMALPVVPAQVITTTLVAALNFVVYQRLVFHEHTS